MTTHLKAHNIWSFVGLSDEASAEKQNKDQLALSQIQQGVDYSTFGKISNCKTAKNARTP